MIPVALLTKEPKAVCKGKGDDLRKEPQHVLNEPQFS